MRADSDTRGDEITRPRTRRSGVACNGRIRHKMWLGMALVVGIMAILLTGVLKGMQGYRSALRAIECKLAELNKAILLHDAVNRLSTLPKDHDALHAKYLKDTIETDVRPRLR